MSVFIVFILVLGILLKRKSEIGMVAKCWCLSWFTVASWLYWISNCGCSVVLEHVVDRTSSNLEYLVFNFTKVKISKFRYLREYSEIREFDIRVSRDTSENFYKVFRFRNAYLILSSPKRVINQVNYSGSSNEKVLGIPEKINLFCHVSFCFKSIRKGSNIFSFVENVNLSSEEKFQLNFTSFLTKKKKKLFFFLFSFSAVFILKQLIS